MIFWMILGVLVLLLVVYGLRVKYRRQEEAKVVKDFGPDVTAQLRQALTRLEVDTKQLATRDIATTWGHEVLVFGFRLTDAPQLTAERLQETLPVEYEITDFWYRDGELFIEIALLRNEATREFVKDLKKANRKS